jgi:hypothetical protein
MNIEQYQQQLINCYNNFQDPALQMIAKTASEYTEYYKKNQITKEEYIKLLEDLQNQNNINYDTFKQDNFGQINIIIASLINTTIIAL